MYENILVPTDGSESMEGVIQHAIDLAEIHDANLHTIFVANTATLSDLPMESSWEGISTALQKQGEQAISAVERQAGELTIESVIREGPPAKEITAYTEEADIDVVVMGTHGRSGVDRLLLGSVAERVVRSSPVPVLTIRV